MKHIEVTIPAQLSFFVMLVIFFCYAGDYFINVYFLKQYLGLKKIPLIPVSF
jgi:hypothetical protein